MQHVVRGPQRFLPHRKQLPLIVLPVGGTNPAGPSVIPAAFSVQFRSLPDTSGALGPAVKIHCCGKSLQYFLILIVIRPLVFICVSKGKQNTECRTRIHVGNFDQDAAPRLVLGIKSGIRFRHLRQSGSSRQDSAVRPGGYFALFDQFLILFTKYLNQAGITIIPFLLCVVSGQHLLKRTIHPGLPVFKRFFRRNFLSFVRPRRPELEGVALQLVFRRFEKRLLMAVYVVHLRPRRRPLVSEGHLDGRLAVRQRFRKGTGGVIETSR